jgi:hypothetical protein
LSCAISDKDESNSKAENTFDFILSLLVRFLDSRTKQLCTTSDIPVAFVALRRQNQKTLRNS